MCGFFGQVVFWRPGVLSPKNKTSSRNEWCVGLAAVGGKAKNHSLLEDVRCFVSLVPQALWAAARKDSWNKLEESGPELRNSKKAVIEKYTFAYPRIGPTGILPRSRERI